MRHGQKNLHEKWQEVVGTGIFPGAFSGLVSGQRATAQPSPLPHTHSSDLAPVPGVSKLCLQVLVGFGVLHIKARNKSGLGLSRERRLA